MPGPIFGDSFGDLSRNVQSAANARQAALANALNTAVSALNAAKSHQMELQKMTQQKEQFGQEMDFRKSQETERTKEAATAAGLNQRYYDLAVQQEADKATQLTPAKQREHDLMFNQADTDAANGTFDNADHVTKMYPVLSASEAMVLANRSADARRQIVSDYTTANNAANVLNQHQKLSDRIYQIDQQIDSTKKGTGFWSWAGGNSNENDATLSSLTQDRQKYGRIMQHIEPIATALNKDKNVSQLVTFDPTSERYVPTVATPRWMKSAVQNAPNQQSDSAEDVPGSGSADSQPAPQQTTRTGTAGAAVKPARTTTATEQPVTDANEPTVKVRGRDGSIYNIPQSRVKIALTRGGSVVSAPPVSGPPVTLDASMWMQ